MEYRKNVFKKRAVFLYIVNVNMSHDTLVSYTVLVYSMTIFGTAGKPTKRLQHWQKKAEENARNARGARPPTAPLAKVTRVRFSLLNQNQRPALRHGTLHCMLLT